MLNPRVASWSRSVGKRNRGPPFNWNAPDSSGSFYPFGGDLAHCWVWSGQIKGHIEWLATLPAAQPALDPVAVLLAIDPRGNPVVIRDRQVQRPAWPDGSPVTLNE